MSQEEPDKDKPGEVGFPSLSYSSIKEILSCPHKFYLRKVEGVEPTTSPAMRVGSAVHHAIATWWKERDIGRVADELTTFIDFETFQKAWPLVSRYIAELGHLEPVLIEQELEKEFEGIKVRGFVDLVLPGDKVVEIKTTSGGASKFIATAHADWQPAMYAWLLGWEEIAVEYHVIDTKRSDVLVLVSERTKEDIENVENLIRVASRIVRQGDYPAMPGRQCQWCGVRAYCKFFVTR